MKIIITADDFGLTKGITDNIFRCIGTTPLTNVSLVPNGLAFTYAVEKIKQRPPESITIHLNTIEFYPVADPKDLNDILNKKGQLHLGFLKTYLKYSFSTRAQKKKIKNQFTLEYRAQIEKTTEALNLSEIKIDSHQHLHMLPFLFDILIELKKEFPITYIRIPEETFCRVPLNWFFPIPRKIIPLIKHLVLRFFAHRNRRIITKSGISFPNLFLGVMIPGDLNEHKTNQLVKGIVSKLKDKDIFELVLHPGKAIQGEEASWNVKKNKDYYFSEERDNDFYKLKHMNLIFETIK